MIGRVLSVILVKVIWNDSSQYSVDLEDIQYRLSSVLLCALWSQSVTLKTWNWSVDLSCVQLTASLCYNNVRRPDSADLHLGNLYTHGPAQPRQVDGWRCLRCYEGIKNKVQISGYEGNVMCSVCTFVLVCVTSERAAVESGPELLHGSGSRELWSRGQQWGGAGRIFLLVFLLLFFFVFLLLEITNLPFFLCRHTLLFLSSLLWAWLEKVVADFGEMRAATAAPWWRPGPGAQWFPSLNPTNSISCCCRGKNRNNY